ncbi:7-deoxyloganetin glucosyltransferase-like [Telopea speciosissima]|uniref:7-deoxyloganetin glucosyltransferase-like n=1 Tax=Telopea speciosissima TaxID=54955 RepID=UPI001CC4C78A|nr:7-deoxyloganetin glucosyltransferase-like [Telopea speciosissima]
MSTKRELSCIVGEEIKKAHAVCIPIPAQGHINAMLKVAKLLHHSGFHITFVNTEFIHRRLLNSLGLDSLKGLSDFHFHTIPDGLPLPDDINDATQDIPALCDSIRKTCLVPLRNLLTKLNSDLNIPQVTGIVSDGCMSFTLQAAEELGIPQVFCWTHSACGFFAYMNYHLLMEKGLIPLKDESYLTNGYLETPIECIPGMKNMRLRDLPTSSRTTDPNDLMLDFIMGEADRSQKAAAVILNTFDALDQDILDSLSTMLPPRVYTIGPLQLLLNQLQNDDDDLKSRKEESGRLECLNSKEPGSVVYVNFGSITVMTHQQLTEFAWGLANSEQTFLWIIRSNLVVSESTVFPPEFMIRTKERGMLAGWCPQEQVLSHPAIGGFLTHSGWNSTLDSICGGVPVICWPFFSEQPTNCRYSCVNWGIGDEIQQDVKREDVEKLVRELMVGDKGKEMKKKAMEWKNKAGAATAPGGSSHVNFNNMVNDILLSKQYY